MRCYNGNIRCALFCLFFSFSSIVCLKCSIKMLLTHDIRLNSNLLQFYLSFKFQIFRVTRKKKSHLALKLLVPFFFWVGGDGDKNVYFCVIRSGCDNAQTKTMWNFIVFIPLAWYMRKCQGGSMVFRFAKKLSTHTNKRHPWILEISFINIISIVYNWIYIPLFVRSPGETCIFKGKIIKKLWLKTNYEISCVLVSARMMWRTLDGMHSLDMNLMFCLEDLSISRAACSSLFCKCSHGKLLGKQYSLTAKEKSWQQRVFNWKMHNFLISYPRTREHTIKLPDISTYCLFVRSHATSFPTFFLAIQRNAYIEIM